MRTIYGSGFAITPSNTDNLPQVCTGLYVGGAGAVAVVLNDGTVLTFVAVPAGTLLPIQFRRINSTGTTATSLVGLID
ncbi:MAG TPA: hypothetical protein VEA16_21995 [Vicinamibacterales bacterium]|nr:hypothetical protein [Vicinamibacterales bacterium]